MIFNPRYKRLGLITMPYTLLFEFMAPIIEAVGILLMIFLMFTYNINWQTFWILFAAVYAFSLTLSGFVIFYDYMAGGSYNKSVSYLKLVIAAMFEPIVYHPLIVIFSLTGYYNYLTNKTASWGVMVRKGTKKKT